MKIYLQFGLYTRDYPQWLLQSLTPYHIKLGEYVDWEEMEKTQGNKKQWIKDK